MGGERGRTVRPLAVAGGGFEYLYGFLGGETNQWYPAIYENTIPIEPWGTPEQGYHFMADMTDKAIAWTRQQKSLVPDKPFFMYFAPGATHAPHHVPKDWADQYAGEVRPGLGRGAGGDLRPAECWRVIPGDAVLTERSPGIPAWDEMSETLKPALARQMEAYAGFLAYCDHHVGRLLDSFEELGIADDTLVYVIIGDNGASAEGSMHGTTNEGFTINHMNEIETEEYVVAHMADIGTPDSYNHYAVGWAHAMDTPYQWTKQVASHWGGTRNGTIVSWPNGIEARGEIRNQFAHAIDVAPTVLEAAGIPEPATVHGVTQRPYEGTAMNYSFDDADAAERHETQYFEMLGNRAIYHKGWTAVAKHKDPWLASDHGLDDDVWDSTTSRRTGRSPTTWRRRNPSGWPTCNGCSSSRRPASTCYRMDIRSAERMNPSIAGRPGAHHRHDADLLPGDAPAQREHHDQHQEPFLHGDREGRGARERRRGRRHRPGRRLRRVVVCTPTGKACVRLQPSRDRDDHPPFRRAGADGRAGGARPLRVRRWWVRQGWDGDDVCR